jgi:hypothetical protein
MVEGLEGRELPSGLFAPAATYAAGTSPGAVAVGDFYGDGKPALAVTNGGGSGTVSVLRNKGDGTFLPPVSYAVGTDPAAVAVGDFNGDGIPDLVVANGSAFGPSDNTVSVLLNKGDGTFAPAVTYASGAAPLGVAVGDFNGDGKQDFAVANRNDNTVSVFLNNGDGTFAPAVTYAAGVDPVSVAVGDFDGDGKPDLVVANEEGPGRVSVLRNNGNGTFAAPVSYGMGLGATSVAVGDFDGDGKPDLAVTDRDGRIGSPSTVSVLRNNGNGTFADAVAYKVGYLGGYGAGGNPRSVAVADFGGTGKPDLVVANASVGVSFHGFDVGIVGSNVSVVRNYGDGTFGPPRVFGSPSPVQAVAAGDFNGDGKPDLVATTVRNRVNYPGTVSADAVQVYLNAAGSNPSTPGVFDPATATWYLRTAGGPSLAPFSYGGPGWQGVAGDWTGAGVTTIGAVDTTGASDPNNAVWYLRNENSGGPPDFTPFAFGLRGWVPVTGDWFGFGRTRPGMFDPATATWYLDFNSGGPGPPDTFQYGAPGWLPVVGDWAGQGKDTIGVVDPSTMTWYLRNDNSGGPPDRVFQYGAPGLKPVVGDWDGNGTTTPGVVDPAGGGAVGIDRIRSLFGQGPGTWYLRNSTSGGPPDIAPFLYGLGRATPLSGTRGRPPTLPLSAPGGPRASAPTAAALTPQDLQTAGNDALARLSAAGNDAGLLGQLAAARYEAALGLADPVTDPVRISPWAAGCGQFVGPTPPQDEAFRPGAPGSPLAALPGTAAAGRMDGATAALHGRGRLWGLPDRDGAANGGDPMADALPAGLPG